jgi:catechol 2,3-dioxygenase-like lactoylglutathione lyase family enzyme
MNDRNNHRIQAFDENRKYLYEGKPDADPSSRHLLYIESSKTTWAYNGTNNKMIDWDLQGYLLYSRDSMGSFPGFSWSVRGLSVDQEGRKSGRRRVDSRDVSMFRAKTGRRSQLPGRQAGLLGLEVIRDSWHMIRSVHLAIATVIVVGITVIEPTAAQERPNSGLSLSTVGIRTKDYAEYMTFYTRVMGLRPAFSFSPNGQTMNTYFQLSPNTFLELQEAPANTPSGFSHIHMRTEDVDASLAGLRQAGVPTCTETHKTGCLMDLRIAQPTKEKSATIVDPNSIRIEPTEFTPGSLTRKALDSWKNENPPVRLLVVRIAVKDYPESEKFYGTLMAFRVAFKFPSSDGQRTTTYYQLSRDTFLEMQPATADVPPGINHGTHADGRLECGYRAASAVRSGVGSAQYDQPENSQRTRYRATEPREKRYIFDPNGLRLELNAWLPDSLPKKAVESWK